MDKCNHCAVKIEELASLPEWRIGDVIVCPICTTIWELVAVECLVGEGWVAEWRDSSIIRVNLKTKKTHTPG